MTARRPTARGYAVAVIAILLFTTGLALSHPVLRGLGGFAAATVAVGLLPRFRRTRPDVECHAEPDRLERGERATVRLVVHNRTGQRQRAFVARDHVDGVPVDVPIGAVDPGDTVEGSYDVPAARRGRIDLGPLVLDQSDPLGLARGHTEIGDHRSIWVQPRRHAVRVVGGGRPRHHHHGSVTEHPLRGSTDLRSLREYVVGDELRHVHARASARIGKLVVREHIDPVRPRCTVVLDNRAAPDRDTFEEIVEVGASIVWSAADEGMHVRLCTAQGDLLDGADGPAGVQPLLDRLAAVQAVADADLARAVDRATRDGSGGWLAVATAAADEALLGRLVGARGFTPVVVFEIGDVTHGPAAPGVVRIADTTALGAIERWNGADLA